MIIFSFIVPIFNCIDYIESCVGSLLEVQKYSAVNYEIVLVDDGSNDGSSTVIDQLAEKYGNRIISFHQKNSGVSAARNFGFLHATGKFIIFIDADDKIFPSEMGKLFDTLCDHPECDMAVYGLQYETIHENRLISTISLIPSLTGIKTKEEWKSNLFLLFRSNALTSVWSRAIKREIVVNNNIRFDESMISFEDLEFNLRAMNQCKKIYFIPDVIYQYQVRIDEGRYQKRLERIKHISDVVDKIENSICCIKHDVETDRILISIYSLFLKDKKIGKNKGQVLILYDEFKEWVDQHDYYSLICNDRNLSDAYHGKYLRCKLRDKYSEVRHQISMVMKRRLLT